MKKLIKQFSKSKPCYYCGDPPSSKEHVPVKTMFKAFNSSSITVPSCEEHNSDKNDQEIVNFLIRGLFTTSRFKDGKLPHNMLKALDAAFPYLNQVKKVSYKPLIYDPQKQLDSPLAYLSNQVDIRKWMRQLTAGLVWSATGYYDQSIKWDNAIAWSETYLPDEGELEIEQAGVRLQKFRANKRNILDVGTHWWPGWSAHPKPYPPDIYNFEVSFLPSQYFLEANSEGEIIFRHTFYSEFSWWVWFETSKKTKENIHDVCKRVKATPSGYDPISRLKAK